MEKMEKMMKHVRIALVLAAALGVVIAGCSLPGAGGPTVISTTNYTATFSVAMDPASIVAANYTMAQGATPVPGAVTYNAADKIASFTPTSPLLPLTAYRATITTGVQDTAGHNMAKSKVWTFTTGGPGLAPVLLGTAGNYVVLAKTAISTVPASVITGDIGLSPAARSYITGFSDTLVGAWSTSPQVTGKIYAADMDPPTPTDLTTAVSDMQTAYVDAAGRPTPDHLNLGSGNIGGKVLEPGLYKWGSGVTIPSNVTLAGGANDIWIFQISGNLIVSNAVHVFLSGGAQATKVFWQLSGQATIGTSSVMKGIILAQTAITLQTGAKLTGRALAQTQVALQKATVTAP